MGGSLSARTVRGLDVLLVVYVVVWTVLGALIGADIQRQADLSDQVTRIGRALTDIGAGLDVLGGLPLVGGEIDAAAGRVTEAGESVVQSGRESRAGLERMGALVGIAFAAVPLMLVLPVYVPLRRGWRREVCAVAAALAAGDPGLDLALARRALGTLPFSRLRELGFPSPGASEEDEVRGLADEAVRRLADEELRRLGLERPG